MHARKVISLVAEKSDRAILFYSGGKDSMALLDLMAPYFKEIIAVYMYIVPGLWHINKYLNYARQKYPNVKIEQLPHWGLSNTIKYGIFCEAKEDIKVVKLKDIDTTIRKKYNIEYSFFGLKKADGMNRNLMLSQYELQAISPTNTIYPLSTWNKADVLAYNKFRNLPPSIEYIKNKSGQGLDLNLDCFLFLRAHYPGDLKKVLSAYPLAEKLLIDYDIKNAVHVNEVPKI